MEAARLKHSAVSMPRSIVHDENGIIRCYVKVDGTSHTIPRVEHVAEPSTARQSLCDGGRSHVLNVRLVKFSAWGAFRLLTLGPLGGHNERFAQLGDSAIFGSAHMVTRSWPL